jgi:ribosome maturation factor RimP
VPTFISVNDKRGDIKSPLFVAMITKTNIKKLADERIAELNNGLFIVEMHISSGNVISLELDKMGGNVAVEDCMSVSRNIEHNLDREEADFELHVSSAGLDKPFRVPAQYEKNIGRDIKVKLLDNSTEEGEMIAFDGSSVTIRREKRVKIEGKKKKENIVEELNFPLTEIRETKVVISFK